MRSLRLFFALWGTNETYKNFMNCLRALTASLFGLGLLRFVLCYHSYLVLSFLSCIIVSYLIFLAYLFQFMVSCSVFYFLFDLTWHWCVEILWIVFERIFVGSDVFLLSVKLFAWVNTVNREKERRLDIGALLPFYEWCDFCFAL